MKNSFIGVVVLGWWASASCQTQSLTTRLDSLCIQASPKGMFSGQVPSVPAYATACQSSFDSTDLTYQQPNTPTTGCQLASLSKVSTSTAVLQLSEQGKRRPSTKRMLIVQR